MTVDCYTPSDPEAIEAIGHHQLSADVGPACVDVDDSGAASNKDKSGVGVGKSKKDDDKSDNNKKSNGDDKSDNKKGNGDDKVDADNDQTDEKKDNDEDDTTTFVFVFDGTGSMGEFFNSLGSTFRQTICLLLLLTGKVNIRLAVYHDYDGGSPRKDQGGYLISKDGATKKELDAFIAANIQRVAGGGDGPEAQKTAFNHLLTDLSSQSVIIHYTDAPPHMTDDISVEAKSECEYFKSNQMINNWLDLCAMVRSSHRVVTITNRFEQIASYMWMGDVVMIPRTDVNTITNTTMNVIMSLIGNPPGSNETYHRTLEGGDLTAHHDEVCMSTLSGGTFNSIAPQCRIDLSQELKKCSPLAVLAAFEQLLTPECVMSLTTNPVFGKFWRLLCSKIKADYPDRVGALCDKLSQITNTLTEPNKTTLQKFVAESYNATDEIRGMLASEWVAMEKIEDSISEEKHSDEDDMYQCVYIVDYKLTITRKDLLELVRGGSSKFGDLISLINHVEMRRVKISEMTPEQRDLTIPTTLAPMRLFQLIPHLLFPGTMFGKRGALIIAAMSLRNALLAPTANEFLRENTGKWIDWSTDANGQPKMPENWAASFFNILKRLDPPHLTLDEMAFRNKALSIITFGKNKAGVVAGTVGSTPNISSLTPSYKAKCFSCNQDRCISILTNCNGGVQCGLCIWNDPSKMAKIVSDHGNNTHMVRCSTCAAHYSIERTNMFNCQVGKDLSPKCHYCREEEECKLNETFNKNPETPTVMCNLCIRNFIAPAGVDNPGQFVCRQCTEQPNSATTTIQVPITQLLKKNPHLWNLFLLTHVDILLGDNKLLTLLNTIESRGKYTGEDEDQSAASFSATSTASTSTKVSEMPSDQESDVIMSQPLSVGFHKIINSREVIESMLDQLINGDGRVDCPMCCESKSVHEMSPACGNCDNRICTDCVSGWYSCSSPGNVITQSHTCCMYCKKTPKFDIIRLHAKVLTQIRGMRTTKWEVGYHHAWCMECNNIKPVVARECATETPDLHGEWKCAECKAPKIDILGQAEDAPSGVKDCPGCGISTFKDIGCDHIECTQCGEHWCYVCGEGDFEVDVWGDGGIYSHLNTEHGGVY
jgi:hypothetical protein